ncbi:MAG: lamin tail domain-containing protein [Candidatus Bathyarchaeota archaeon]|nr:lamin tail domain-containing protein [Candidatus Bathyarchaeota archaeon]
MQTSRIISKFRIPIILFLTFTFLQSFVSYSSAQSNIVINEFELNPVGDDYQAGNEWVELYNPTTSSVDISNWKIMPTKDKTIVVVLPEGTIIRANGYHVANYSSQWLDNDNELIILQDSTGNEIDRTPSKNDTNDDGRTWSRNPNGIDTDTDDDWQFQESTKEVSNGGEEPSPTPSPTTEPSPTPELTSPSPPSITTTTETTTSSEDTPVPVASAKQTANYLPYITIPLATLAAITLAAVYLLRIRPSKIQQNRHQQMIHEYELALEALDHMDIAAARKHVIAAKRLRDDKT